MKREKYGNGDAGFRKNYALIFAFKLSGDEFLLIDFRIIIQRISLRDLDSRMTMRHQDNFSKLNAL